MRRTVNGHRPPRKRELDLLRSLRSGARALVDGPVGNCVKRGWCSPVISQRGRDKANIVVTYVLTEDGLRLLQQDDRGRASAASRS